MSDSSASPPSKAGIYAMLALAAAVLIGAAVGYALARRSDPAMERLPRKQSARELTMLGISRGWLLDSLGLAPAQRSLVDSLLESASSHAERVVNQMMTEVREVTVETRTRIRATLDDRQRARFDSALSAAQPMRMRTPLPPRTP